MGKWYDLVYEIKDQLDPYVQKTNSSPLGHKSNQALLELC